RDRRGGGPRRRGGAVLAAGTAAPAATAARLRPGAACRARGRRGCCLRGKPRRLGGLWSRVPVARPGPDARCGAALGAGGRRLYVVVSCWRGGRVGAGRGGPARVAFLPVIAGAAWADVRGRPAGRVAPGPRAPR